MSSVMVVMVAIVVVVVYIQQKGALTSISTSCVVINR